MEKNRQLKEPIIFALIRELFPTETELADEPASLSDKAFCVLLVIAGVAALGYAFISGVMAK